MRLSAIPILLVSLAVACGKSEGPTSPTSSGPASAPTFSAPAPISPSPAGSATISGSVTGLGSSAPGSVRPQASVSGLVVSIVGTNISTAVDASNRFVLQYVPTGDQDLRFAGAGVNAEVSIAGVQESEAIDLTIRVNGTSATIESEQRSGNASEAVQVNGLIEAFSGVPAIFQFQIGDRLIKGDAATEFFGNTVFADIANGLDAEVKGLQRDGFVYAARLHVSPPDDDADDGDDDDDDDGQDESASIEGALSAKSGLIPNLTLIVDGTTVLTNSSTLVRRRGDVQDLSSLQLGMTLHVVGVRASDGSLTARMIQIKDDAAGGIFEIQGPMGGVQGTCPAIQFVVNGYSVSTDGTTTFTPSCSALKSGTKVKVIGTRLADGSVLATSVTKQ